MKEKSYKEEYYFVATFINDLFCGGIESDAVRILKSAYSGGELCKNVLTIVERVVEHFEKSKEPTKEFLEYIGAPEIQEDISLDKILSVYQRMDNDGTDILVFDYFGCDGKKILNSAVMLYGLGLTKNADELTRIGLRSFINYVFKDERALEEIKEISSDVISNSQREKAKKPRNPYYSEVIEVIRLTWEMYPCAPKTGLIDDLAVHYHKKVSRNSINSWIESSGLRPPKPAKYTSFELVFPQ